MSEHLSTSDALWLDAYISESTARGLCTKIQCTTCGALEFRRGLLAALATATGSVDIALDLSGARFIGNGLAHVSPRGPSDVEKAIRLILFDIWTSIGEAAAEREVAPLLHGTWCGTVLEGMKAHSKVRDARQAQHLDRLANARDAANAKQSRKQERLEARLAAKKERDRRWWEHHKKPEA